jgi:hypothetical protein
VAEKLNITNRQLLDLRRGLNSLDAVKAGKDGEVIPLEFEIKTRARLMTNAVRFEPHALAYDKLDRAIALEAGVYEGMEKTAANGQRLDVYRRKIEELLDQPVEVDGVLFVRMSDLLSRPPGADGKRATNPVPQSVLIKLAPIITEEVES